MKKFVIAVDHCSFVRNIYSYYHLEAEDEVGAIEKIQNLLAQKKIESIFLVKLLKQTTGCKKNQYIPVLNVWNDNKVEKRTGAASIWDIFPEQIKGEF